MTVHVSRPMDTAAGIRTRAYLLLGAPFLPGISQGPATSCDDSAAHTTIRRRQQDSPHPVGAVLPGALGQSVRAAGLATEPRERPAGRQTVCPSLGPSYR
jgi:hypothetical protein